jgi:NCS2 family nucleobase:cation symporter-2
MIQAAMLFAGVATLLQTVGLGPIGARLPLVQGTSFAFISVMIPIVAGKGVEGMAALTTAAFLAGLLHAGLSRWSGRSALPCRRW